MHLSDKEKQTFLPYLLFMNPHIGLNYSYTTQHCKAFHSSSAARACNRVYHTELPTRAEIEEIRRFFGDSPFTWAIDDTDAASIQLLQDNGLSYTVSFPAMIVPLGTFMEQEYGTDIIIRTINTTDSDALMQWLAIASTAFNTDRAEFAKVLDAFIHRTLPETMTLYLGSYQGNVAAAGMVLQHQDVATLHWIGTLPEYRNKGLGYAITHAMLADKQKAGCIKAFLLASDSGKPLYENMGFKEYARYRMYGNY